MVSLYNNDGVRLRLSQDETMTQFPNYLYDPYAFPSNLNLMDYQWNLFYPQNHHAIQSKRKRKLKEQLSNERVFREMMPSFEYKKSEVIDWLRSLTVTERFKVFSFEDSWLTAALIKMYKKWSDCNDIVFAMLSDIKKSDLSKNSLQFEDLENHFYCRRKPSVNALPPEKQQLIEQAEKAIIEKVRIYDSNDVYDTIVFDEHFLEDIDKFLNAFETISEGFAFTKPCKLGYDHNTKSVIWESPVWFSPNSFQTFSAWLVSSLERVIWIQYFTEKKSSAKAVIMSERAPAQISLKYKCDLVDFWKFLDINKKKKIFSSIFETYKTITGEKPNNCAKDFKDINQKLKFIFDKICDSETTNQPSFEDINSYFQRLLSEEDDDIIIKKIIFTSFDDFGTIINLICRKLTHKLKTMLSEKIATDLIMNEEKQKNKKTSKKKKLGKGVTKAVESPLQISLEPTIKGLQKHEDKLEGTKSPSQSTKDEGKHPSSIGEISGKDEIHEVQPLLESSLEIAPSCTSISCENQLTDKINNKKTEIQTESTEKDKILSAPKTHKKFSFETQEEVTKNYQKISTETEESIRKQAYLVESTIHKKILHNMLEQEVTNHLRQLTESEVLSYQNSGFHKDSGDNKDRKPTDSSICSTVETKNSTFEEEDLPEKPCKFKEGAKCKDRNQEHQKSSKATVNIIKERKSKDSPISRSLDRQNPDSIPHTPRKAEIDTTDSESGLRFKRESPREFQKPIDNTRCILEFPNSSNEMKDIIGFIEVKPKKKKSVKPSIKVKKDLKEVIIKKKKEKPSIENLTHEKEKEKVRTSLAKPIARTPIVEARKTEETKKIISTQSNSQQIKASISKDVGQNKLPVAFCPPSPINKPSTPSQESTNGLQISNKTPKLPTTRKTLSLMSPSLDIGAIQATKAKNFAKEIFDKKFSQDIYDHVAVITEKSNKMMEGRILVYKRLDYCITKTFPMYNMKTKIFGSCATGLALPTSDVDIAISGIETYDRPTLCECLVKINEILKSFKWLTSTKPILTAHVPVLKLEIDPKMSFCEINDSNSLIRTMVSDAGSDLDLPNEEDGDITIKVDLTLESLGMMGYSIHMGYKSTEFAENMLKRYNSLYIITMILKEFLYHRKFLNTYQGGISSYCLTVMVVAILQKYGDEGYMPSLRRILKVYGESFQPEKMGIILSEPDPFFILNHSYETAPLWIMDHNNIVEKRNIGQGAYSIRLILNEFEKASKTIEVLQQKFEEMVLQHKNKIQTVEDILNLEDPNIKGFIGSSILESFMTCV